jgi:Tol biopolymer transport system component
MGEKKMGNKTVLFFLVLLFFLSLPPVFASTYDWGTTGVASSSRVEGILQLTDNSFDNSLDGPPTFIVSPWSRDGKWIVYRDSSGAGGNIYNMNTVSGLSYSLTEGFLTATDIVNNPSYGNDNKIYFEKKESGVYELWRMNDDGTGKQNLSAVHSGVNERFVKVSPDAQWIAFFQADSLWVTSADGSGLQKISGTILVNGPQHSWSPDSQWLTFQGVDGVNRWIYKVKRDGTGLQSLTEPTMIVLGQLTHSWPAWSPDGEKIAYIWSSWDGTVNRYYLRTITSNGEAIFSDLDYAISSSPDWLDIHGPLSWGPDSRWLAYARKGPSDLASIFIINVVTPGPIEQLTTGYTDRTPFWSPRGDRILFADAGQD